MWLSLRLKHSHHSLGVNLRFRTFTAGGSNWFDTGDSHLEDHTKHSGNGLIGSLLGSFSLSTAGDASSILEGYGTGELEGRAEILLGRFSREAYQDTGSSGARDAPITSESEKSVARLGRATRYVRLLQLVAGRQSLGRRVCEAGDQAGSIPLEAAGKGPLA